MYGQYQKLERIMQQKLYNSKKYWVEIVLFIIY